MDKKLNELLSDFFCEHHQIDINAEYRVEEINAKELLTASRLDLIAKLIWIRAHDRNIGTHFADDIYSAHIKAITGRTCREAGKEEEKSTVEDYSRVFAELLNIRNSGFDRSRSVIPVDKNGIIMDGAHRTAVGIYYDMTLPIIRLDREYPHVDADFLLRNLMKENYVEYLVSEYCKFAKREKIYAICLWPNADGTNKRVEAERLIYEKTNLIYKKEIQFTKHALRNFMIQIYCSFNWMGSADEHFPGATEKANACWKDNNATIFYFVEGPELEEILKLKQEIRDIFCVGNHSVHITDKTEETIEITKLVLNDNSLDLLTNGAPDQYPGLNHLIYDFKQMVVNEDRSLEDFAIESSSVLGLYGLREPGDVDYIYAGKDLKAHNEKIDEHMSYIKYYDISLDDLICDPGNYFYYFGVKFITLQNIRNFKMNRGEEKDRYDIKLIDSLRSDKINIGLLIAKYRYQIKRLTHFYFIQFKIKIKNVKWIAPIYNFLKKVLKKGR